MNPSHFHRPLSLLIVTAVAGAIAAGSALLASLSDAASPPARAIAAPRSAQVQTQRLAAIPASRYTKNDPRRYISALRGPATQLYAPGVDPKNMITSLIDNDHLPGRPHDPWASPAILNRLRQRVQHALVKAGETPRAARMTRVKVLNHYVLSDREYGERFPLSYVSWAVMAVWGPHRICVYFHVDPTMWDGWTDKNGATDWDDATCGPISDVSKLELRGGTDQAPPALFATWALLPDTVTRAQTIYNRRLNNINNGKLAVEVPILNNVATIANAAPLRHQVVRYLQVTRRDGTKRRLRIVSAD